MRWATRKDWARALLVRVIPLFVWFVFVTNRWRMNVPQSVWDIVNRRDPVIYCFWHGRMLLMPRFLPKGQRVHVLISRHRDGRLISEAIARMKLHTVAGSSSRGARGATVALIKLLRAGDSVCITPDGPRGPRMRAQKGAVAVAAHSGAPIIPIGYSTSRAKFNRSWDRFLIPWPFGRASLMVGAPMLIPADADDEAMSVARRALEQELNRLTAAADEACGHEPVRPDAVPDEAALDSPRFDAIDKASAA